MGKDGDLLDVQRLLIYRRKGINPGRVVAIYKRLSGMSDPPDQVLKGLARFSFENGAFHSAIRFMERMRKPDDASRGILWRAMLGNREIGKAKESVENYIKENPDYFDSYFILARIEAESGNRADAERNLIRALENGYTDLEEINSNPDLKEIFDSLAHLKEVYQDCLDKT